MQRDVGPGPVAPRPALRRSATAAAPPYVATSPPNAVPGQVWNSWQADYHYAHFLVNHLPMIYWLAERTPPDTRVLIGTCTWCADSLRHRTRRFLSWFDPSLAKRVSWISMEQVRPRMQPR